MPFLMVSEQEHSSRGNWGTAVAAVHNTQLSRQIGEQLLRAICLTSQIVEAGEKGNRTALPSDSHGGFGLRPRSLWTLPLPLKTFGWWRFGPAEKLTAVDAAQRHPECRIVCSLPAKGWFCCCQGQGEVRRACFSKHLA